MKKLVICFLALNGERVWSLFQGVTWRLPLVDAFLIQVPLPSHNATAMGTMGRLRKELEKINRMAWQAIRFAEEQQEAVLNSI